MNVCCKGTMKDEEYDEISLYCYCEEALHAI